MSQVRHGVRAMVCPHTILAFTAPSVQALTVQTDWLTERTDTALLHCLPKRLGACHALRNSAAQCPRAHSVSKLIASLAWQKGQPVEPIGRCTFPSNQAPRTHEPLLAQSS